MKPNCERLDRGAEPVRHQVGEVKEGVGGNLDEASKRAIGVESNRSADLANVVLTSEAPIARPAPDAGVPAHASTDGDAVHAWSDCRDAPHILVSENNGRRATREGVGACNWDDVWTISVLRDIRRADGRKRHLDEDPARRRAPRIRDIVKPNIPRRVPYGCFHTLALSLFVNTD